MWESEKRRGHAQWGGHRLAARALSHICISILHLPLLHTFFPHFFFSFLFVHFHFILDEVIALHLVISYFYFSDVFCFLLFGFFQILSVLFCTRGMYGWGLAFLLGKGRGGPRRRQRGAFNYHFYLFYFSFFLPKVSP